MKSCKDNVKSSKENMNVQESFDYFKQNFKKRIQKAKDKEQENQGSKVM